MNAKKEVKFKAALSRLEKAVRSLEEDEIDLEKSVDIFVDGMKNAAICHEKLNEAQKKIQIVMKDFGKSKETLKDFDDT